MNAFRWQAAFLAVAFGAAYGQDLPAGAKPADPAVGSYTLVVTTAEPSASTHLLNPPILIKVNGGTERAPAESFGNKTIPFDYAIDSFATPLYDCVEAVAGQAGCDALDRADLKIRGVNGIEYHLTSHGPAALLEVDVLVHDIVPVSQTGASIPWHAHDVIFVTVPKATASLHFVSEVLAGNWNNEAIVFEVGKALPASAQRGLEDLGIHQDLGDKTLYSYRVKEENKNPVKPQEQAKEPDKDAAKESVKPKPRRRVKEAAKVLVNPD